MTVSAEPLDTKPDTNGAGRGQKSSAGSDVPYRVFLVIVAVLLGALTVAFFFSIIKSSIPGWQVAGWQILVGTTWDITNGQYGALPLIAGTFVTTCIALLFAVPVGIGSALGLAFLVPRRIQPVVSAIVELLAVVPSVIYGLWGFYVIKLTLIQWQPKIQNFFGGVWPFTGNAVLGVGIFLGSIVLAVMILPTITAISRDVLAAVPRELTEGGLSLGATRSQTLRRVVLPSARAGLLGAVVLGTGRALGETIALVFLLGGVTSSSPWPSGLFRQGATLASTIAENFGELSGHTVFGVLCCLALVLMLIVAAVNFSARALVAASARKLALK
jgi:phosphate transport system permease protein